MGTVEFGDDMRWLMPILALNLGCRSKMEESVVKQMIIDEFDANNPTSGTLGYELFASGEWPVVYGYGIF